MGKFYNSVALLLCFSKCGGKGVDSVVVEEEEEIGTGVWAGMMTVEMLVPLIGRLVLTDQFDYLIKFTTLQIELIPLLPSPTGLDLLLSILTSVVLKLTPNLPKAAEFLHTTLNLLSAIVKNG